MTGQKILILIAFVLYLSAMLYIGYRSAKKTKNSSDFFLAGRQLGPWFTALSAEASDMSAWLLLGLPGVAYFTGLKSAFWTAVGLAIGTYLNWLLVAKRLRKYSIHANNSITIPEFFANRFHDDSNVLKAVSSLIILIFFIVYTASGFLACAKLFTTVFNIPYIAGLIIGVAIILGYTLTGGFLAVCSTDFVQGMLMFVALVATVIVATFRCGGIGETAAKAAALGTQFINPFVDAPGTHFGAMDIVSSLAWGLGYFGMPHILVRFMAIRSNKEVRVSRTIAMIWVLIAMAFALLVGVVGHVFLLPEVFTTQAQAETVFMTTMMRVFPAFIAGVFLCGILAASMSTADSQLLVAASAFSKDIYKAFLRKDASEKKTLFVSRVTILVISMIAIIIALDPTSSVFDVVSYAWAGFGATFGPVILGALFWKKATKNGAVACLIGGGITVCLWKQLSGGIFEVYELLPGFIIGSLALIIFSLTDRHKNPDMEKEFDAYLCIKD